MIARVKRREVVSSIILSFVTCGIYGLVWFVGLTNDCGDASGDHSISGGMAILLTIVTCGLYMIYWNYKMGKELFDAQRKRNLPATDNSVLYLILGIFGLSLVNYILIQTELNKISDFDYPQQVA